MGFFELLLLAVGLSMDTFAVAITLGLAASVAAWRQMLATGLYFGVFQAVMPVVGYLAASLFAHYIIAYDHWVAFTLLLYIGGKMLLDSLKAEEPMDSDASSSPDDDDSMSVESGKYKRLRPAQMLPLALATSIDALAVGVSFAFLNVRIALAAPFIGLTTCAISMAGVKVGQLFGIRYKEKAEFAGGAILILIGLKILLEHVFL